MEENMEYSNKICLMKNIKNGFSHGPAPIPQDGEWNYIKEIKQLSGLSHGIGHCAPQQGACKLSLNVKNGIIEETLVETVGCSGMTHSAAMASEILPGKTLLEALNTDLVCDAINCAMREIFLQIAYGRSQSAYSKNGLSIGTCLEDLGENVSSHLATMYGSKLKGPRYFNIAEGYVTKLALNQNSEIIGYEYVNTNKMMKLILKGISAEDALADSTALYGQFEFAVSYINPREE
jgi:NifU-like protein involved in Fe-S cluster formation